MHVAARLSGRPQRLALARPLEAPGLRSQETLPCGRAPGRWPGCRPTAAVRREGSSSAGAMRIQHDAGRSFVPQDLFDNELECWILSESFLRWSDTTCREKHGDFASA